jgi:hypothetical protein
MIVSLMQAAEGSRGARWTTIGWLAGAVVLLAFSAGSIGPGRCAIDDYTGQATVCVSPAMAGVRNALTFGLPALLAIGILVVTDCHMARRPR